MNRRGFLRGLVGLAAAPVAAKILPSVLVSFPVEHVIPPIGHYADYVNFSDLTYGVSIDPILLTLQKEMNYRLAMTLECLVQMTS